MRRLLGKGEIVLPHSGTHSTNGHWFACLTPCSEWGFPEIGRQPEPSAAPAVPWNPETPKPWWRIINVCRRSLWRNETDYGLPLKSEVYIFRRMKFAGCLGRKALPSRGLFTESSALVLPEVCSLLGRSTSQKQQRRCLQRQNRFVGSPLFYFWEDSFSPLLSEVLFSSFRFGLSFRGI